MADISLRVVSRRAIVRGALTALGSMGMLAACGGSAPATAPTAAAPKPAATTAPATGGQVAAPTTAPAAKPTAAAAAAAPAAAAGKSVELNMAFTWEAAF